MTLIHAGGLLLLFFLLLLLELFIPSGGLLGVAAGAALIGAILIGFLHSFEVGGSMLIAVSIVAPMVVAFGLRMWPRTPMGRKILNVDPEEDSLRREQQEALRRRWLGRVGVAKMDLLPSGTIEIAGHRLDAVSVAGVIDRGTPIEVVNVSAGKIQVRPTSRIPDRRVDPIDESTDPLGRANGNLEVPIESLGIDNLDDPFR
jgi:membrane-bound serine protease (ClpP class)